MRGRAAGLLVVVLAVAAGAQVPTDPEDPDLAEALDALADAGEEVSPERVERLAERAGPSWQAGVATRVDRLAAGAARREVRGWWRRGGWSADLRRRGAGGDAPVATSGWLTRRDGRRLLLAGRWTWTAGHGLVAGGAGRRPGLGADGTLGPRRAGPRPTGARDGRGVVTGVAAILPAGRWRVAAGTGRTPDGRVTVVGLCGAGGDTGALLVASGGAATAGLRAAGRRGVWAWSAEAALPAAGAGGTGLAWQVRWRPRRGTLVEGLALLGEGAPASPLAAPVTLLGPDGGRGWALRGVHGAWGRVRVQVLVSAATREDLPGPRWRRGAELALFCRTASAGRAEIVWRGRTRHRLAWPPQTPWRPPSRARGPGTTTWVFRWRTSSGASSWRLEAKRVRRTDAAAGGRRTCVAVARVWQRPRGVHARAGLVQAWGDPVDLVTVLVPSPGRVLARHWGRWERELWLGAGWRGRRLAFAGSLHRRLQLPCGAQAWEIRLEAAARW